MFPQLLQPLCCHDWSREGFKADKEVFPLDGADVRVPLGREGVNAFRQDLKSPRLLTEVGGGSKRLSRAHVESPFRPNGPLITITRTRDDKSVYYFHDSGPAPRCEANN